MKWTVAGAGALLCAAGFYALISGSSIIQVERGWATFIAGAVLLGAGVIVFGIAALMGRIDRLTDLLYEAMTPNQAPWAPETEAAEPQQADFHDAPPRPREAAVDPAPAIESLRAPQPAAPVYQAPPPREPVSEERPAALRDFQFVFPPAEAAPEPPAAYHEAPAAYQAPAAYEAPASVEPPAEEASEPVPFRKPLGRPARMEWLRRGKTEAAPAPETTPAEESHEENVAPVAPVEPIAEASEPVSAVAPEDEPQLEAIAQDEPEPAVEETPAAPALVSTLDPFGADWLERALAGADEQDEPTSRFARRTVIARDESVQAEESAPEAAQPADEPEPGPATDSATSAEPGAAAPVEIGRYRANDVAYVMFSDGSITAETPAGASYRFNSLPELRAFIERGNV